MRRHCVILSATADREEALRIARALVDERLAACVTLSGGAESVYRWKGEVCREQETLMLIKTLEMHVETAMVRIRQLHSYETPEMIVIPVTGGDPNYLKWLEDSCTR